MGTTAGECRELERASRPLFRQGTLEDYSRTDPDTLTYLWCSYRLYVKNLDESYPAPTSYELSPSSSGGGPPPLPTLSSIRAVTNQNQHLRDPSAALSQSPYSLPLQDRSQYDAPPTSSTIGFSDPNSLSPASAFRTPRAAPRRPSEPPEPFAQPRAPPSPPRSQGRARSQSQSQPTRGGGGGGRFDASDAPPMPGKGGSDMTESYAPVVPRSRSGPDQRATTSGEFSRAGGGGGGEAEIGGWGKVKRSMTLVKRSGRAEVSFLPKAACQRCLSEPVLTISHIFPRASQARAAKAAARDPNRSPSPPRVGASPLLRIPPSRPWGHPSCADLRIVRFRFLPLPSTSCLPLIPPAAAPKMYTAAQLAVEMEKAARDAETEEQRAYRASCLTMGPRLAAAEAKESSRLAESFF